MKVIADRGVIAGFRRRALKQFPREYIEAIWGRTYGDVVHIHALQNIDHLADTDRIFYYEGDEPEFGEKELGMVLLGTVHSHPECEASPSLEDWLGLEPKEKIQGIMEISKGKNGRKRTSLLFYECQVPVEVSYPLKRMWNKRKRKRDVLPRV